MNTAGGVYNISNSSQNDCLSCIKYEYGSGSCIKLLLISLFNCAYEKIIVFVIRFDQVCR